MQRRLQSVGLYLEANIYAKDNTNALCIRVAMGFPGGEITPADKVERSIPFDQNTFTKQFHCVR